MPSGHAAAEELVSNRCRLATVGELMRGLPPRIQAPWLQGPPGAAATKPETDPEARSVEIKISISKKKTGIDGRSLLRIGDKKRLGSSGGCATAS